MENWAEVTELDNAANGGGQRHDYNTLDLRVTTTPPFSRSFNLKIAYQTKFQEEEGSGFS